jgi:flagellar basal body-associated protein FliL
MLSSDPANQNDRSMERPKIAAILLIQFAVLLALSGAAIFYVNWSSAVAQAEFVRALEPSITVHPPQSPAPVQSVKARAVCPRKV